MLGAGEPHSTLPKLIDVVRWIISPAQLGDRRDPVTEGMV